VASHPARNSVSFVYSMEHEPNDTNTAKDAVQRGVAWLHSSGLLPLSSNQI
jgi:hypothetical protein